MITALRHPKIAALPLILLMGVEGLSADWPQFRGPGGQGISQETDLPVQWGEQQNLAWKTSLPGFGASSPIAVAGHLYVTCYSGYWTEGEGESMEDLVLHLVCVQPSNGKILWDQHIHPKLPESRRVRDHGYAAPTPASDGKHLYIFLGKTGVLKFDLDGQQHWQADVGSQTHRWGCGTSPVLVDNLVIVNASVESGSLVAIDKQTGTEVWRMPGMEQSWTTPQLVTLANGQQELVVSVRDKILAFDPATGEPLWNCEGIHDYVCSSAISQNEIIYVLGGRQSRAIAVRAGGRGDVTATHRLWETQAGANVVSPVIYQDHMYWVSDRNKIAYCVRLSDGEIIYAKRFPAQPYASGLAADGKIFVVTRYEGTYVLAAKPEFTKVAHNELDDESTFNASPIVSGSSLILRSNRYLYCLKKQR